MCHLSGSLRPHAVREQAAPEGALLYTSVFSAFLLCSLFWVSSCKLSHYRGLQHSSLSLSRSYLSFNSQPTPFLQYPVFWNEIPWIFQAKLPPNTCWHNANFWRKSSAESALSSGPLTRHLTLTLTNGSLWTVRSVCIQDAEQSPALTNRPQGFLWFTWAPSGELWPGACHSCYIASSWNSLQCLLGNSATQWYLSLGASSSALFQCRVAAGAGQSGKQLHLNVIPTSLFMPLLFFFFFLGHWFLDLLFCEDIRPVWERLLLCSPGSIKSFFPLIWFLFSQT